jgi:hypothetical protein
MNEGPANNQMQLTKRATLEPRFVANLERSAYLQDDERGRA